MGERVTIPAIAALLALHCVACSVDRSGLGGQLDGAMPRDATISRDATPIDGARPDDGATPTDAALPLDGCSPASESCNDRDDDCDGAVDEDVAPRSCGSDVGACTPGVQACVEGGFGVCEGAVEPSTEVCDGAVDEDCDGSVDEGCGCVDGETRPCGVDTGRCELGVETCAAGTFGGCTAVTPRAERCDGVDDDCDGSIDETAAGAASPLCPCPWAERGGHAYLFCRGAYNWADGRARCQELGYDYVKIGGAGEQSFVWAEAEATGPAQDWWIGLNDRATEGAFQWTDGSPLGAYGAWNPGQPDDGGPSPAFDEDCVELNDGAGGAWNDLGCDIDYLSIVCEAG